MGTASSMVDSNLLELHLGRLETFLASLARKVSSLDRIRAELLARVSLLRSTKWKQNTLHNSALLLDEAINLHFINIVNVEIKRFE